MELAFEIGCRVGELLTTYLGLPWVPHINWRQLARGRKNGFERDYQRGKGNISQTWRLTLIQSKLFNLPIFF